MDVVTPRHGGVGLRALNYFLSRALSTLPLIIHSKAGGYTRSLSVAWVRQEVPGRDTILSTLLFLCPFHIFTARSVLDEELCVQSDCE